MKTVNIHEAKTHLSRLIDQASEGKECIIAKAGKPVAKLSPFKPIKAARKPGYLKGKIKIATDFDAPLPDALLRAFEGKG